MPRTLRILLLSLALLLTLAGAFVWSIVRFDARPVIPGAVYRSKQPSAAQLDRVIRSERLRSVVNLRGRNEHHGWYRDEVRVANAVHVAHYDVPFATYRQPPKIEVQKLVATIDAAPRPMLLHCETGNDRSGWASAIALLLSGEPLASARKQLSLRYGHVCANPCTLDGFLDEYARWLKATGAPESADAFRRWSTTIYCPEPYNAVITVVPDTPLQSPPAAIVHAVVSVRNLSHSRWTAAAPNGPGIRLGARIAGPFETWPRDSVAAFRGIQSHPVDVFRDSTIRSVVPGAGFNIGVSFPAPAKPGIYAVQFDMVNEGVHWFSDMGTAGAVRRIEVR